MSCNLSQIAYYASDRISVNALSTSNYISTENMVAERGGVILSSGLPNVNKTKCFKKGDVLVSNIRPYFKKIWKAEFDGGCSNDILVFRPKSVSSEFLYYVLCDDAFFNFMMASSTGTKMPRGNKQAILKYPVNEKAIASQTKIVSVLEPITLKVELNRMINDNLVA